MMNTQSVGSTKHTLPGGPSIISADQSGGRVKQGLDQSMAELVEQNVRFGQIIASRILRSRGLPTELLDELKAAANLGLVEAANKFDPSRGFCFLTYACKRVKGAVIEALREHLNSSGVTGFNFKAFQSVCDAEITDFEDSNDGSDQESSADVRLAQVFDRAAQAAIALQLSEEDEEHAEALADSESNGPEQRLERRQFLDQLKTILHTLSDKEQMIIREHYFNDRSFTEIADNYEGMSKSWVSRLHFRALDTIKKQLLAQSFAESNADAPGV